ncbi:MAG: AMP-binding protein, partial [Usitatibacter sp.]
MAERTAMIVEDDALGTSSITYGELAARTTRFAQHLAALGVEPGDRVLVRLPNSIDYPTAFLGAMKRGAIAVPTSTLLTAEEVRYLVEDSGAKAIVVDEAAWRSMSAALEGAGALRHVILGGAALD